VSASVSDSSSSSDESAPSAMAAGAWGWRFCGGIWATAAHGDPSSSSVSKPDSSLEEDCCGGGGDGGAGEGAQCLRGIDGRVWELGGNGASGREGSVGVTRNDVNK
jgi:hypothetical protein